MFERVPGRGAAGLGALAGRVLLSDHHVVTFSVSCRGEQLASTLYTSTVNIAVGAGSSGHVTTQSEK